MSPHKVVTAVEAAQQQTFPETDLHIMGIAAQYPEHFCVPQDLTELAHRYYPRTPA